MIAELGHFALILAFLIAIAQSTAPLIGAERGWADFMRVAEPAATAQFTLLGLSFAALTYAFVTSDFSVALAANHSHSLKPMLYKISGVWGNHEGSMLLWVLILALFGAMVAWFGRSLPTPLKARTLAVQGMIGAAFLAFIIFTSNPFLRLDPAPVDGGDLNPLLQDPGLAFHPPFLYLGYVGLSTAFSFAVAALIEGRIDPAWARWVRPWALAAWMFLTLGIALGSYWAYYELGWGGWWFWDPVENASFMPWLAATALLHSAIVVEKRGELKSWTILLAILAFSLSLMGTFIVRSGLLTSVHAFASDPTRGVFILLILAAAIGGSLTLYAARGSKISADGVFAPVSRESALLLNNVLLAVATAAVFSGTMAPLVYEAFGKVVTVGPPYFDWVFGLLMLPLLLAVPVGALLPWKRADLAAALRKLWAAALISALAVATAWAVWRGAGPLAPLGAGLAAWLLVGAVVDVGERARWRLERVGRMPRADWGKALGHGGLGLMVLGVTLVTALETEDIRLVRLGDRFETGGYTLEFRGVKREPGPNYTADIALVEVYAGDRLETVLRPEKRFFPVQRTTTTEASIRSGFLDDVYVVLGDKRTEGDDAGAWALRTYVKPFANWIWIGALVMSLGGLISLTDRRHRVGAPARRGRPEPGGAAVPAE
ncbi:MAG: heme lyase CcmF/NrfE family subunit [Rhodobacteraceae bacterium]|nr:heme lyase CcmF/NrfE family subunit [Paracoccaceae bacterium]